MELKQNALIRYGFLKLLMQEFNIYIEETDLERIELAKRCIFIYDSPEEFYKSTGWARDNPEQNFAYLLENKVCSILDGRIWYFSQLCYDDGIKELRQN